MTTKRNVPTARTAKGLTTPEVILYYRNKSFAAYAVLQQNGKSWYLSQQSLFPLDNRKKGLKSWWWWYLRGGGVGREMEHGREYRDIRQRCSRKHGVISTKQRWRKKWSQGDGQKRIYYDYENDTLDTVYVKLHFDSFNTLYCHSNKIWNKQVQSYAVYKKEWKKLIKTKKSVLNTSSDYM